MTVSQMHTALRLNIDKTTALAGSAIDFLPEELNFWLNEAQIRFIKQRLFGTNTKQQGFESTIKRYDDLNELVTRSTAISLTTSTYGSNVKRTVLTTLISDANNPYMYFVSASLFDASSRQLEVKGTIDHSNIYKLVQDSLNQVYIRRPLISIGKNATAAANTDNEILVIYDSNQAFTPSTIMINYIRRPRTLSLTGSGTYETSTCELPLPTHNEVVTLATELLLENIESQRVQTYEAINASKME